MDTLHARLEHAIAIMRYHEAKSRNDGLNSHANTYEHCVTIVKEVMRLNCNNGEPCDDPSGYCTNVCRRREALTSPLPPSQAEEPVGYADGSRFHELREGRLNLALWADRGVYADTPLYTRPQPAAPATVTDEDVKRALDAKCGDLAVIEYLVCHNNATAEEMMRAALESFANKKPTDE